MKFYWRGWRKFAHFNGRTSRREFVFFVLVHLVVLSVLGRLGYAVGPVLTVHLDPLELELLEDLVHVVVAVPVVSMAIRRLHDIRWSGWLLLLLLVPVIEVRINAAFFFVVAVFLLRGDVGSNRFGPDPALRSWKLPTHPAQV